MQDVQFVHNTASQILLRLQITDQVHHSIETTSGLKNGARMGLLDAVCVQRPQALDANLLHDGD